MALLPSLLLLLLAAATPALALRRLQELYGWKQVEFEFPSAQVKDAMVQSGDYVVGNGVPIDIDVFTEGPRPRVFVTFPRLQEGTPLTLAEVVDAGVTTGTSGYGRPLKPPSQSPLLRPFPDWSWHRQGECEGLTSVFRIQVDTCGRLWAMDTGRINILSTFSRICQPQVVVFDLRGGSNRVMRRHHFSDSVMNSGSLPVTIAVDVRGSGPASCGSAFAYAADVTEYALVVYDLQHDRSWRVEHKYFYPYPMAGTFNIAGETFDLMDGVLGLALSPELPRENGDRRLYFHSLASFRENYVSTNLLRNESLFANGANLAKDGFHLLEGVRPSQSAAEAMDGNGVLYFSYLSRNSINCWVAATGSPYSESSIVELDRDDQALQFASGVKVVNSRPQELWVLTSRFQKLMAGGHDPSEINFRVLRAPVTTMVKGTKCDSKKGGFERPSRPGTAGVKNPFFPAASSSDPLFWQTQDRLVFN